LCDRLKCDRDGYFELFFSNGTDLNYVYSPVLYGSVPPVF